MPIERGDGQFSHIRFQRVPNFQPDRRRRPFTPRRPPSPSDRTSHAQSVSFGFSQASEQVTETRQRIGIDPNRLFVLEFSSLNLDIRDAIERYQAWIVDEYDERDGDDRNYRFLIQFPTETSRQLFVRDLQLYREESDSTETLPPGMRRDFFDALQMPIRTPSREERMGIRLRQEGLPEQDLFYLDVDFWHPPTQAETRELRDAIRGLCERLGGRRIEEVQTSSLLLAKIQANRRLAEALLDLDLVARVDLPPRLAPAYSAVFNTDSPLTLPMPSDDDPMVCVVDSGVLSGHPFLVNWVIEERDFGTGEDTPTDLNGHGTSVAGLVVYGRVADCLESQTWQPQVKICSAKVLLNDAFGTPVFPDDRRVEAITEEAIRYFAAERQCKIFNLSVGISYEVYGDGRQFAWAEKLDELTRELDVVIVVSSGNHSDPPMPEEGLTREQFQAAVRDQLISDPAQRLCNPATAALALTVGAIASSDALGCEDTDGGVRLRDAFAAAPANAPPPFTRVGPGYASSASYPPVKPDLVGHGGNYALQTIAGGAPRWNRLTVNLGEPTLCLENNGQFVSSQVGTSFAAPHVAHAAAMAMASLTATLGRQPSANLIRALVGSSAATPNCPEGWLGGEDEKLRLVGYGLCNVNELIWSRQNAVRLIAMDVLEEDKLHVYRVPIPDVFMTTRGRRGISVALAYDPPVRASRREYLARTLQVEVLQGLTTNEVETYRAKQDNQGDLSLPARAKLDLRPPRERLQWSTLQVRHRSWPRKQFPVAEGESEPAVHVVVRCQQRFPTDDLPQGYGLVATFWHESQQVELYQALRNRITVEPTKIRVRG
ncbi:MULTISPECIES: S8 family peptidase [Cyanophyceae]|uniref:S8 family peptidase n=1 Tax=Leptolyngbya subtilissima DQ-A4 TaxID=2933933 RepID=A0ABV0JZG9_9CYAN|nr:S8 family peptidase [Nodosilinea sp. FACHB-141]MBD2112551.1 S8 family peptidase [Nodosilinea sp. FACHB-141]